MEYQLRERILQRLRFLLQNKVWRENRLFASIRSLFPECCVVCWMNDEFSLSFLVTYEAKDSIAKMNSNIRKQHRKATMEGNKEMCSAFLPCVSFYLVYLSQQTHHTCNSLRFLSRIALNSSSEHYVILPSISHLPILPRQLLQLLSLLFPPRRRRLQSSPQLLVHRLQTQVPRGKRPQRRRHLRKRETGNVRLMAGI